MGAALKIASLVSLLLLVLGIGRGITWLALVAAAVFLTAVFWMSRLTASPDDLGAGRSEDRPPLKSAGLFVRGRSWLRERGRSRNE
jgi:hypothetical protein